MNNKYFRFLIVALITLICVIPVFADTSEDTVTVYDNGYRGEGMVIAVIDTEFDVDHEMFVLSEDTEPKLSQEEIQRIIEEGNLSCSQTIITNELNPYVSSKVPFAFDYTSGNTNTDSVYESHGTHVAGILSANNTDGLENGFDGIAPEAQLILMKVADAGGLFSEEAINNAVMDAVKLGADVINCSFGSTSAYPLGELDVIKSVLYNITKGVQEAGIDIVAAIGNESRVGYQSTYYDMYGIVTPLTEITDYGTPGTPSSFPHNISVANAREVKNYRIELSDGDEIFYDITNKDFNEIFGGKAVEYVLIPNLGEPADYKGIDAEGKIAVVERGIITFDEKVEAAHKAGAIGVLIYNNIPGEIDFTPLISYTDIPCIIIRQDYGVKFIENKSDSKIITFFEKVEPTKEINIKTSSSWGATNMLTLEPDITAFGTNIYSTLKDNEYGYNTGTSMSAPYVSGCLALLRQHMREVGIDVTEDMLLPRKYLMTAAEPMINPENGIEYSPRLQGSGLVNINGTYDLDVLLWNEATGVTKVELGEVSDKFEIKFMAQNLADKDYSFKVNTKLMTDGYYRDEETGKYFTADYSEILKRSEITVRNDNSGYVTIPAGETVEIIIDVTLDKADINKYERAFIYGFFVEGFVYLERVDYKRTVSIPFMGYYGDWSEIPVSVEGFYETSPAAIQPMYGKGWSPDSEIANDIAMFLTRDVFINNIEVITSDGTVLEDIFQDIVAEGYWTKTITHKENAFLSNSLYWDGKDIYNHRYTYPDGEYTVVVYYELPYKRGVEKTIEIPFVIDTVKPKMVSYTIEDTLLTIEVYDNYYLDSVMFDAVFSDTKPMNEAVVEIDISAAIEAEADFIYIYIFDVAGNMKVEKILL
jgi:Subtilisin-like serine proteases